MTRRTMPLALPFALGAICARKGDECPPRGPPTPPAANIAGASTQATHSERTVAGLARPPPISTTGNMPT
jgi:hypothetical protein